MNFGDVIISTNIKRSLKDYINQCTELLKQQNLNALDMEIIKLIKNNLKKNMDPKLLRSLLCELLLFLVKYFCWFMFVFFL